MAGEQTQDFANQTKPLMTRRQKEVNTSLLIANMGLESMLYPPLGPSLRHPYTSEIITYAEMLGYTQTSISEMMGCSQPTVSNWRKGEGKACVKQLQPLIQLLTSRVTKEASHLYDIIESIEFDLPENWELTMLSWYCNKKYRTNISPDKLHEKVLRNLTQQLNKQAQQLKQEAEQIEKSIALDLDQLVTLTRKAEDEANSNLLEQSNHEDAVDTFLSDRPDIANLDERLRSEFIEKTLPKPECRTKQKNACEVLLEALRDKYSLEGEDIEAMLTQLLDSHKEKAVLELEDTLNNHQQILNKESPFGHYNFKQEKESISVNSLCDLEGALRHLVMEIYPENYQYEFEFRTEDPNLYFDHKERFRVSVNVSPQELLFEFLLVNVKPRYVLEQVQLIGEEFDIVDNFSSKKVLDWQLSLQKYDCDYYDKYDDKKLTLVLLQSTRLALIFKYTDYHTNESVNALQVFSDVEKMLKEAAHYLTDTQLTSWKEKLVHQGYLFPSARVIC